jgi:hypothetical protein
MTRPTSFGSTRTSGRHRSSVRPAAESRGPRRASGVQRIWARGTGAEPTADLTLVAHRGLRVPSDILVAARVSLRLAGAEISEFRRRLFERSDRFGLDSKYLGSADCRCGRIPRLATARMRKIPFGFRAVSPWRSPRCAAIPVPPSAARRLAIIRSARGAICSPVPSEAHCRRARCQSTRPRARAAAVPAEARASQV